MFVKVYVCICLCVHAHTSMQIYVHMFKKYQDWNCINPDKRNHKCDINFLENSSHSIPYIYSWKFSIGWSTSEILLWICESTPSNFVNVLYVIKFYPNYSTIEVSQNTEKSPGDIKRLAFTEIPVKDHQLMLVWKL